ncbi:MAG: hypothetical protein M1828_005261 [Chrysothrix sp. TS-e1954]|nr:MAG: hypothetical protein M1828_005261 [Chrysothrix sp. TS-e1954]
MADAASPPPATSPPASSIPAKRTYEESHIPSISSPLNPDARSRTATSRAAPAREQREKKDSLKKREATGASTTTQTSRSTPDRPPPNKKFKGYVVTEALPDSPVRYNHPLPRDTFHYTTKRPLWAPHEPEPFHAPDGTPLQKPLDHTENKKNYRYTPAVADSNFSHIHYYRTSDSSPTVPRLSLSDSDKWLHFSPSGLVVTNEKGWRMGRANVCVREGTFYYEVKLLRGVPEEGPDVAHNGPLPHVRVGFARREAPLDAPVGFDGYSYGLTDVRLEPMHKSRPSKFLDNGLDAPTKKAKARSKASKVPTTQDTTFSPTDHARTGDVIGLEITLPSLNVHRKVADGTYNPAVDTITSPNSNVDPALPPTTPDPTESAPNTLRDRYPVPYKGAMYFESHEYKSTRIMEAYGDRGPFTKETPNANHGEASLRCLPGSSIKVYKNGEMVGTAFRNLMAFLPPCSTLATEVEGRGRQSEKAVPGGLVAGGIGGGGLKEKADTMDDGAVGYFPAIGLFSGGVAEVNLGPDFAYPPEGLMLAERNAKQQQASGGQDVEMTEADADGEAVKEIKAEPTGDQDITMAGTETVRPKPKAKSKAAAATPKVIRPMSERYAEQIAEDVVYDIVDEVDFFVQDGGSVDIDAA